VIETERVNKRIVTIPLQKATYRAFTGITEGEITNLNARTLSDREGDGLAERFCLTAQRQASYRWRVFKHSFWRPPRLWKRAPPWTTSATVQPGKTIYNNLAREPYTAEKPAAIFAATAEAS